MSENLSQLSSLFTMLFAVSSMLSVGLSMSVRQIVEPLRNVRLVILALVANFAIMPLAAVLLSNLLSLAPDHQTGLILISAVAGAPMVIKLAQIAKGDMAWTVAMVALLVVGTIIYAPLALPRLLPGVAVDPWAVAQPLLLQIGLPLVVGLFGHERYPEGAANLQPIMGQISNISIAGVFVVSLGLNIGSVFGLFGTGAILAIILFIAVGLIAGYVLGGPDNGTRRVLSVGTGQRNLAAAFVIAGGNFGDRPDVLIFVAAVGLLAMIIIFPVAGEFGKRATAEDAGGNAAPAMAE